MEMVQLTPFRNNQTFRLLIDLSAFVGIYDFAEEGAVLRAQAWAPGATTPAYEWATNNGRLSVNPTTHIAEFVAPLADARAFKGGYEIDCRLERPNRAAVDIFKATLPIEQGATRLDADGSSTGVDGIGATVFVVGFEDAVAVIPVELSTVLAAAQEAEANARDAVATVEIPLIQIATSVAQMSNLFLSRA